MQPGKRGALSVVVGAAVLMTLLNGIKPLHIDDPFSLRIAQRITEHPTDPYGFDILWVQWLQPVHEELTPPLVPYWWALGLTLLGNAVFAWKLWFLPFAVLLAISLCALLRRFAPGTEIALTLMTLFSPAFLPAFNLMQDVPAVGLGLAALALYLTASDRRSLVLASAAGLIAGLAAQTKYTAVGVLVVMVLHALLLRRLRTAVVAVGVALGVFFAWEGLMTLQYGQGMFFGQLGSPLWSMQRSAMIVPLGRLLGGAAPMIALVGLAGLGLRRVAVLALASATLAAYATLIVLPGADWIYPVLGAMAVLTLASAAARLGWGSGPSPWAVRYVDWLLVGWLISEIALYFASAPFPAVRRVMGVIVAATFVVGRLASLRVGSRPGTVPLAALTACGAGLGLLFWLVDLREAMAQRTAPRAAVQAIHQMDPDSTIWYVGHWGFQHYAEEAGLLPVIPDVSRLHAGDWLVLPDRVHQQEITLAATDVERRERLELSDPIPLVTGQGYYAGDTPLDHSSAPRLSLTLLRLRRDVVPASAWPPEQIFRWARYAPEKTAAGALPALRRLLSDDAVLTRTTAAQVLAELGPRAAPAADDLRNALRDAQASVRSEAARALGRIGDPAASQDLRALLEDPAAEVRQAAAEALGRLAGAPG